MEVYLNGQSSQYFYLGQADLGVLIVNHTRAFDGRYKFEDQSHQSGAHRGFDVASYDIEKSFVGVFREIV